VEVVRRGQRPYRQLILIFSISSIKKLTIYDSTVKCASRPSSFPQRANNGAVKAESAGVEDAKMGAEQRESIKNLSKISLVLGEKRERGRRERG
jgi:hypothetical protein